MIVGMPVVFSMYGQDAIEIQTIITALQIILMVSLIVPMYEFNGALNGKRAIMRNESLAWSLLWYKVAPEKPAPSIPVLYLGWLSDTVHALAFFNIGFFMHTQKMIPERNLLFQILGLLILKFVVAPMVMFLSAYVTGVEELAHHTIVVQSFIPSASILFAFAEHYDVMPELMAPVVLYGALLSLPASLFGYLIVEAVLPDLV
ncbi:hypothetical protein SARC_05350 [Sphaeroforma arctica JP610]|uniref:Auxin efflux carrier n=1 Tax=Sphaeroforma arctica JP610 TaxID=667725 RepID=A0A0L0FZS3_9EUKA|nr:hypothetical protein SARC_05350 [Sphaeroforma arctica JP610]KNC82357.1 hypothetical protein SARC_05350 [Sphaeroforma arctica JP610]|eukprot:XP_014156259.1 hypothetical protein SARC_05350 [Sphaeroforma arctica JP610]